MLDWEDDQLSLVQLDHVLEICFAKAEAFGRDLAFLVTYLEDWLGDTFSNIVSPDADANILAVALEEEGNVGQGHLDNGAGHQVAVEVLAEDLQLRDVLLEVEVLADGVPAAHRSV